MNHHLDKQMEAEAKENKVFIGKAAAEIISIGPLSSEFVDFEFLWNNREKIIRNRGLIDLLG